MNVDFILNPKSCCFCLKLKTGCYIIAIINMLVQSLLFYEELKFAIMRFSVHRGQEKLAVLFTYELLPTVALLFTLLFVYGLVKEKKLFVSLGFTLASICALSNVFVILMTLIRKLLGLPFLDMSVIGPLLFAIPYQMLCMIVTRSQWKQMAPTRNALSLNTTRNTSVISDD